jgi:hypothetical protein
LPPPLKNMLMNGLFMLLSKTYMLMDMILLQDPKACMVIFTNMETIGTLCNSLVVAFGQWYLYPTVNVPMPSIHVKSNFPTSFTMSCYIWYLHLLIKFCLLL